MQCYPVRSFLKCVCARMRARAHTHSLSLSHCSSLAMLGSICEKPPLVVCRLAVALNLMTSGVTKHWPWSLIFSLGKSQKSPSVRYGEYGGRGMSAICFPAKNCCTAVAMWPGELSWCRIHLISSVVVSMPCRSCFTHGKDPVPIV